MNISITNKVSSKTRCVVLFAYDEKNSKKFEITKLPALVQAVLKRAQEHISYEVGQTTVLPVPSGAITTLLVVGLGKKKDLTHVVFARAVRSATRAVNKAKQKSALFVFPALALATQSIGYSLGADPILALYTFASYKKSSKKTPTLRKLEVLFYDIAPDQKVLVKEFRNAKIIAEETNKARELSNIPGGDMTPTLLAEHAKATGEQTGVRVTVFDEKKMKGLGMGAVLGVARGSSETPKFITMEYTHPDVKKQKPIVFVGKGVTFDTGGLNIKPDMSMYEMHLDMAGGASVIHAIASIARLKLAVHVVALIPAVENMPGNSGYRPGDILKSYSGKTIEVKHTDAEGRLILADALSYAKIFSPRVVIDVATLTGAALVALGQRTSAIMSSDSTLEQSLRDAGEQVGDRVWPLPLWPEFKTDMESDFADIANMSKVKYGGTITGGAFLWEFAPMSVWAHIDIAPTMTTIPEDNLSPGAKGTGVQLLTKFVMNSLANHA